MAWRVSDALTPTMHHLYRSSDLPMLRDHARRNEEASGLFVPGYEPPGSDTGNLKNVHVACPSKAGILALLPNEPLGAQIPRAPSGFIDFRGPRHA